jgi:hypothetical protein
MWPKEDYQEHMLSYLEGVRIEFELLVHSHVQQYNLNEFYTNLHITFECLWQLIAASDVDWEGFRYPLETSCDKLLCAFHHVPYTGALKLDVVSFQPISSFVLLGTRVVRRKPELA